MLGKVLRNFYYCEVFCENEHDSMDVALHTGDTVEVIRDFTDFDEDTYLCMVEVDGSWDYSLPLPMEDIELLPEQGEQL